ncbi:MAG: ABC transporter permease [Peptococcaceae bacterium BICA1-8]|nr:MAG: ABC transporter permease [Peptococcaceae bacterium BICA1-8]
MNIKESIIVALEGVWVNKMRSALTMLGIIIGVAAVIAVVAIGQGGQAAVMTSLEKIGTNLFMVYARSNDSNTVTTADLITVQDVEVIRNSTTAIKYISPVQNRTIPLKHGKQNKRANTYGIWPDYKYIRNIEMEKGRFITEADEKAGRRVVVIDSELAQHFFGHQDPLLKQIDLLGISVTVIGVTKSDKNFIMGPNQTPNAYVPFSAFTSAIRWNYVGYIEASAVSKEATDTAIEQTKRILHHRHRNADKYNANSLLKEMEQANQIMAILQLIVGSIAGISLFVGGIGVMNIMLVSVTERTREIGIRKALGAQYRDIMIQFLIEAVVICLIGGAIGTFLGVGGSLIVAKIANWPPLVSPLTIMVAFIFSAAIGIFFGIYPANKAAKLDPIEALRYE